MEANDEKKPEKPQKLMLFGVFIQENGELEIRGNFDDDVASYGILEKIRQHIERLHRPTVVKPASFLQSLRQNGKH